MDASKAIALILVVLGIVGLAYGGFTYSTQRTAAKIGDVELKVNDEKRVNIPAWAGAAALLVGGVLLIGRPGRS